MADEQDPRDQFPRDVDEAVDPADLDLVADELGQLTFLRPEDAETTAMPGWAWDRLASALAAEADQRASGTQLTGVPATRPRGSSRIVRWGGGLAAASLAVIAIGAAVIVSGGSTADVVAGDAPATSMAIDGAASLEEADAAAGQEIAPAAEAPSLDAGVLQAPQRLSFAGMVPPAQMLVDSNMNYTADSLGSQVTSVLRRFGVDGRAKAASSPAPEVIETTNIPGWGFTASEQALRDCITKLTRFADSTALMVDRSDFEGSDAGVVVTPTYAETSPAPDMTHLQVWVVDPDCEITMEIQISMTP